MNEVYKYKKAELKKKIADLRQEVKANVNTIHREIERRQEDPKSEWTVWFYRDIRGRCQQFEKNLDRLEYAERDLTTLMDVWDE